MEIKIFIDAGHNIGTVNAGAIANGIVEAELSFLVADALARYLRMNPIFEVACSRETMDVVLGVNQKSSLRKRVELANDMHAHLFISIHANANEQSTIQGSEVYVYKYNTVASDLAKLVLDQICGLLDMKNNGVKTADFYVLKHTKMPAILVELGYLTNKDDASKLKNCIEIYAFAIYLGICEFFNV